MIKISLFRVFLVIFHWLILEPNPQSATPWPSNQLLPDSTGSRQQVKRAGGRALSPSSRPPAVEYPTLALPKPPSEALGSGQQLALPHPLVDVTPAASQQKFTRKCRMNKK